MMPGARELTAPHYSTLPRDRERRLIAGTRLLGRTLEIREELSQGGTAVVYRAIDHSRRGQEVALKVMTAEVDRAETRARFDNEAQLGASLGGHPNIVRPLRMGSLDGPEGFEGRMFLLTELVHGPSLDMVMVQHPTGLSVERACSVGRDIAQALVDLHERGIIHRDIKPGNILIDDSDGHAMLADFGLAYATGDGWEDKSPDLTEDGHIPGTPLYMAPEALAHERPSEGFDMFSFGVTLYELLAGAPPYATLAMGALIAHKCDPGRVPYPLGSMCPELPDSLSSVVHRCMAYDANERPSAAEVLAMLERVLVTPPLSMPLAPAKARSRALVPLAAFGTAALVAALVWAGHGMRGNDVPARDGAPELTAASYAKVGIDTAPERAEHVSRRSLGGVTDVEPAIEEPAAVEVTPHKPKSNNPPSDHEPPVQPARPPKAERPPGVDTIAECDQTRTGAHEAAKDERWTRVLRLTKGRRCWGEGYAPERQKLRTWAYLETERFSECVGEGRGAKDGLVVRWTVICTQRIDAQ